MIEQETLIALQRSYERHDLEKGAARYLAKQDRTAEKEGYEARDDVKRIIRGALPLVASEVTAWIAEASAAPGRSSQALAPLKELDADVVAFATLSRIFSGMGKGLSLLAVSVSIGKIVQAELEARLIKDADGSKKGVKRIMSLIEKGAHEAKAIKSHEALAQALDVGLCWSDRRRSIVGGQAINAALKALPGILMRDTKIDRSRAEIPVIALTEAAQDHMAALVDAVAWTKPLYSPMVTPPRPWTHVDTGAYLDIAVSRTVPLVRTYNREHTKLVREAIKDGSMQPVLDSLNALQGTAFAIDTRILAVLRWVWAEGKNVGASSFPLHHTLRPAAPERLSNEDWEAMTLETRMATARQRRTVKNIRMASGINAAGFLSDLEEADRLADMEAFYLPYSLDNRGRVYAVPHFNPQRSDHIKALFRFADPCPYGDEGGSWMAIHLATCGDFKTVTGLKASKAPFPEREQWTLDHEAEILAAAADPFATFDWWRKADSPFCFLQACFEYADWVRSGYSADFEGHVSVALDGSCSGLQHYSAFNRAEDEGYHVNLLPRPDVGDIYNVVTAQALPTLQALAATGDEAANLILAAGFDRSTSKRNVMTYFYGSNQSGMTDQHMEDTMRPAADKVALGKIDKHPYEMMALRKDKDTGEEVMRLDGGYTCASLLAASIYHAVVAVAPKADQAAKWFQGVAALLAHESHPVIWRTPMGMPVVQRYSEYTSKAVNLWLYNSKVTVPTGDDKTDATGNVLERVQLLMREAPTNRINKKKARSAIAPNVIHSLDAAHLQRVALMAHNEGMRHFQFIHDSFATHAGNTGRFFQIIREAFVAQYETFCPFEELTAYARSVLSDEGIEKLEALAIPVRGRLDLNEVLQSDFAFA